MTVEYRPLPKYNKDGSEKHILQDGARYHVISWGTLGQRCSEPNCEINRDPLYAAAKGE